MNAPARHDAVWGSWDKIWELIKQVPLLGLLVLVAWRLPLIHEAIKDGYEENAKALERIILIQQADHEKREANHAREMERLQTQLNAEMARYQELIRDQLDETKERVQDVEERVEPLEGALC